MKIITISFFLLLPYLTFSQEEKNGNIELRISRLEQKSALLNKHLADLKAENLLLKELYLSTKNEVNQQLTKGLELQAQNETAMNLALDQFEKKFKEQNETFSFVQNQLDKKLNSQLILLSIFMIAFIIIIFILTRYVGKKVIKQHMANWNSFQEHILKNK